MRAMICLDVPYWQIGKEVSVYFPDTMTKSAVCESAESAITLELVEKLEHGVMVCNATGTSLVHMDCEDAKKLIAVPENISTVDYALDVLRAHGWKEDKSGKSFTLPAE